MTGLLYAAAARYARGEISREEIILTFTSCRYVANETRTTGLHDDLLNVVPGSFDDVEAASLDGLIDEEIYAAALGALQAQTSARKVAGEHSGLYEPGYLDKIREGWEG